MDPHPFSCLPNAVWLVLLAVGMISWYPLFTFTKMQSALISFWRTTTHAQKEIIWLKNFWKVRLFASPIILKQHCWRSEIKFHRDSKMQPENIKFRKSFSYWNSSRPPHFEWKDLILMSFSAFFVKFCLRHTKWNVIRSSSLRNFNVRIWILFC